MAIIGSQLVAAVSTSGVEKSKAELESVGAKNDEVQRKISDGLKFAAIGGGLALAAAGVVAVKMAGDFQSGMTSLVTGAGESEKNLKLVSDGILKMAVDTGTSTKQLTDGMYMIESAGFHGAAGLKVLQAAAEGAKVGNADLGVVANGVTTIMVDYAKQNVTAAQATNMLIATVAAGKTHMQDLASALSTIAPTAAAVGLHVTDMNAALATMTGEGTAAADAATYLRQLLIALEAPGSKATSTLKEIGLTAGQVSDEMKVSLPDTLQMITDALKTKFPEGSAAYVEAIKNIAGGSKQMQGILELTGTHLQTFQDNVTGITKAVKEGGTSIRGWALVQDDFNFKLDKVKTTVETLAIRFGTMLLPELTKLLDYVQVNVIPQLTLFSDWFQKNGIPAIDQFSQQIGPMVGHLVDFAKWMQAGSPPAQALTVAAIGLGVAIAAVKIGILVGDIANFVSAVPGMMTKILLVQGGMTGIGTASEASAAKVALASASEEGSLATVATAGGTASTAVSGIGLTAAGAALAVAPLVLAVKYLVDHRNDIIDWGTGKKGTGSGITDNGLNTGFFGNWWQQMNQQQADAAKQTAQQVKDVDAQIKIAYQDMSSLYDKFQFVHGHVLGDLSTPLGLTGADVKIQEIKTHLDDIAKPYEPQIITRQIEAARQQAIIYKSHLDDLKGPVNVGVLTPQVEAARQQAIILKSRLDDTKGPFSPNIDKSSINAAISTTQYLALQLNNLTGSYTVGVNMPGHASGITNNPQGHMAMVGERGPEPMWIPQGASIWPHGSSPSAMNGPQNIQVDVYLDGAKTTRQLMPHIVTAIRSGVGSVGY